MPTTPSANTSRRRSFAVELAMLAKTFHTPAEPIHAVQGVNLRIAPGETVALLGPNGAGKSTTIDMLLGLAVPDTGVVRVFGRPPSEAVEDGSIGAMLQTGGLIPDLSVRELVTMVASLYPAPMKVDDVLQLTGIDDIARQRTNRLSGGQTQRVRAAIALVGDPRLLVLDEPTVGMDVESRRSFWQTMRTYAATGRTILFATHYLDEADDYADRAVLMARGRVVADGPTTVIKGMVGSRTIRATVSHADRVILHNLPGVVCVDRHGDAVILTCSDSDSAVRALLQTYPDARDIEITGAGLEQAFLQLTADEPASTPIVPRQAGAPQQENLL
jgi:ABC-2 type transport system ATP-binding protein